MIHPSEMASRCPPCVRQPGLFRRDGLWACAQGLLHPLVYVDSGAEIQTGFEALMFHEALHAVERHALIGLMLLAVFPAWVWWRREQEVRADVFALEGAGLKEFVAFTLMHPHPTGWFWKWCYGKTPQLRISRATHRLKKEQKQWADA